MVFEAVIFDWDGTLADTEPVVVLAFQTVLREIGCIVSDEFLERLIGIGVRNMLKEALESTGMHLDDRALDDLVRRKNKVQLGMTEKIELLKGAVDILESLHDKVKIALATMSNRVVMDKVLAEKGLRKYFNFVITADEVERPKPDPEVFLECAKELRCLPEKCVVVEDSVFGVIAARKADMKCIAVPSGAYSAEELRKEEPDLIVNSLEEKQKILNYILT